MREESKPEGTPADIVFEWLQKPPTGDKASVKATENNYYSRLVKAKKIEKEDNEFQARRSAQQLRLLRWRKDHHGEGRSECEFYERESSIGPYRAQKEDEYYMKMEEEEKEKSKQSLSK
jgi:hypothetical protein